jgi:hypothetical protein
MNKGAISSCKGRCRYFLVHKDIAGLKLQVTLHLPGVVRSQTKLLLTQSVDEVLLYVSEWSFMYDVLLTHLQAQPVQ